MAFSPTLSHVVLVITGGVLFYAALTDFKYFKIRNELILVLAGLFVLHALLSGRWMSAHWNLLPSCSPSCSISMRKMRWVAATSKF
jgi:Flp pilus assembly protein protease CpaA